MKGLHRYVWWSLLVLGLLLGLVLSKPAGEMQAVRVPCPDIVAGCGLPQSGLHVRFDRRPMPMQSFRLQVALPEAREVHASFSMHGMEMGLNRYRLLPDGPGRWQAEVILPACVQGRNDWVMRLEADGRRYELSFSAVEAASAAN